MCHCRFFLGVTYLSEICNVQGTHLVDGIGDGNTTNLHCPPLDDKIYQPFPNTQSWSLWDKFLQSFTIHPDSSQLCTPLGSFHHNHSTRHLWKAYKHKSQAFISDPSTSLSGNNSSSTQIMSSYQLPHLPCNLNTNILLLFLSICFLLLKSLL